LFDVPHYNPILFSIYFLAPLSVEVYPRPDGTIYICGIGGSDYISTSELKQGAFRDRCEANPTRVKAAMEAFQAMTSQYSGDGDDADENDSNALDKTQACMRPCPPDANPYMGRIPGFEGAYINAGHNCWYGKPLYVR
jgi:glycine/D-amino acid oxidase-like deaminating enzyme